MKILKHIKRELKVAICHVFEIFPLQKKIIFDNFHSDSYGGEPKYIAEELARSPQKKTMIWVYKKNKPIVPDYITPIKLGSLLFYYHLSTAKVWVDNVRGTFCTYKRKGQFYIQTWHAILGLKKIEKEAPSIPDEWKDISKRDSKLIDLMVSNNDFYKSKFENVFWYDGEVLKCDSPKMSLLVNTPTNLKNKVFNQLNINKDAKVVLYAPTFRKTKDLSVYEWDYEKIIRCLENKFGGYFIMLLRMHPIISNKAGFLKYTDKIINVTSYPDMQELLAISDIQINDYSSSMFEFGFLKKPVFLFCKDLEDYKNGDRELEFDFEKLPFPLCQSQEELIYKINNFNQDNYNKNITSFYEQIGMVEKGEGAKILANIINEHL